MRTLAPVALVLALTTSVGAQIVRFDGIDPGVGPGQARPNADAAAAAFDLATSALAPIQLIAVPNALYSQAKGEARAASASLSSVRDEHSRTVDQLREDIHRHLDDRLAEREAVADL